MRFLRTLFRSLALHCPACGQTGLFRPYSFRMLKSCAHCGLSFEGESGFYLGSIYINYGVTSVAILSTYMVMTLSYRAANATKLGVCLAIAVMLPVLLFRHARSLWLGMDVFLDRQKSDAPPHGMEKSEQPRK